MLLLEKSKLLGADLAETLALGKRLDKRAAAIAAKTPAERKRLIDKLAGRNGLKVDEVRDFLAGEGRWATRGRLIC